MMISVAMATFNGEKYILEQLSSIWRQGMKPDEIIISDDHSTDRTVELIREFQSRTGAPIRLIFNEKRAGFIHNFSEALRAASGDIIFLCDQDDIWLDGRIEVAVRLMTDHPEILALSVGYDWADEDGNVSVKKSLAARFPVVRQIPVQMFLRHPKYPGMAMSVRRPVVDAFLRKDNDIAAHDWQLNLIAAQNSGMFFYGKKLILYRQHTGNTVGTIRRGSKDTLMKKRLSILQDMADSIASVYGATMDENAFALKLKKTMEHRKELLKGHKSGALLLYGLLNRKYVSLSSVMGDVYVSIKGGEG